MPICIPTVCPGSSDPPDKILNIFASENEVWTIITTFKVEYYSFTAEQNNFRSHELDCIK